MPWMNLALAATALALLVVVATSGAGRWAVPGRRLAAVSLQIAGVMLLTGLATTAAAAAAARTTAAPGRVTPADTALLAAPPAAIVAGAMGRSVVVIGIAGALSALAGLAAAVTVSSLERRRLIWLNPVATVVWVAPTFLLALLVQEVQAFSFGLTGLRVAAGFGEVNALQTWWVAAILALRPASYFFRHTRAALDLGVTTDYVRTARAKGLAWRQVVVRHILRANAALVLSAWLNSFRAMVGSLPLVEFLFGYPGLGRVLLLSLGLTYSGGFGPVMTDLAIELVAALAFVLIAIEVAIGQLTLAIDPRLRVIQTELV
jgi:peptide/nickel transport system permease protein